MTRRDGAAFERLELRAPPTACRSRYCGVLPAHASVWRVPHGPIQVNALTWRVDDVLPYLALLGRCRPLD